MQNWVRIQILENLIQVEIYILILTLCFSAWLFYKVFLKTVTEDRHKNLKARFGSLFRQTFLFTGFYLVFNGLTLVQDQPIALRFLPYLGLLTVVWGSVVFIQACRIMVLQYLFLTSMRAGVPLLLVNIFTLVLSLFLASWIASALFGVQLAPLLATSAAFSLILGLALQDTLGNLFAGISLQLDNTFEIGDWLEVANGSQKIIGQVQEITWRAVFLYGLNDEEIIVPNRLIAQSQVSNWSRENAPILKTVNYKLKPGFHFEQLRSLLTTEIKKIDGINLNSEPIITLNEIDSYFLSIKVAYFINDYGRQGFILDNINRSCLKVFSENQIELANPKLELANR